MRCQEGEGEEDDPPLVPRLGTRTGSTLLFSTTTRFCDMKQKRNYSFLTSRSIAKTSYTIRSSGVLLQTGRVFLMTFIVGVKSYMEVSNETSDRGIGNASRAQYFGWAVHPTPCDSHLLGRRKKVGEEEKRRLSSHQNTKLQLRDLLGPSLEPSKETRSGQRYLRDYIHIVKSKWQDGIAQGFSAPRR